MEPEVPSKPYRPWIPYDNGFEKSVVMGQGHPEDPVVRYFPYVELRTNIQF